MPTPGYGLFVYRCAVKQPVIPFRLDHSSPCHRVIVRCVVPQFLKDLQSRAQGEVTIREALQELKAWAETAEFSLLEHVSSGSGKKTHIIQQWKDLFTEVGDNQSLLQVFPSRGVLCLAYHWRRPVSFVFALPSGE